MLASKLSSSVGTNSVSANYIEDVFSTWLYNGNGGNQTITNGIDLSTKGGLVWMKCRSTGTTDNTVYDTARGVNYPLFTNTTAASSSDPGTFAAFNTTGFRLNNAYTALNETGQTYASWTFRKQPKFFDVVTYTGNGVAGRQIAHNLGSTPGCIIVKDLSSSSWAWSVWHRGASNALLRLNSTLGADTANAPYIFGNDVSVVQPTSTAFTIGSDPPINTNGDNYVAYVFAHDAGGFGLTGTDNVISCGSFVQDTASGATVTLGYEPQFLLVKRTDSTSDWFMLDVMRGQPTVTGSDAVQRLAANLSDAEVTTNIAYPTSTGFYCDGAGVLVNGATYIYIAVRRGPMKVPTTGTSVFQPVAYTGTNVDNRLVDAGIVTDMTMARIRTATSTGGFYTADRLRANQFLGTAVTDAGSADADSFMTPTVGYGNSFSAMNGFGVGNDVTRQLNQSSTDQLAYAFRRAPSFFDEVCYTGTGVDRNITHNLGVAPELIIVKARSGSINQNWNVCFANTGANNLVLNDGREAFVDSTRFPTSGGVFFSTYFKVGTANGTNASGYTYVAYLFATCAGVSKVGSYTGTGATQTISCGFTGGARFVLIKRTDLNSGTGTAGDWYVWDTARGMVSGTDPYLLLDSTAAEVNTNSVYTTTGGFQIVSTAADINASGSNYIYLAIA